MPAIKRALIYPPPLNSGESMVMLDPEEEMRKKRNKKNKFKCPDWAEIPPEPMFEAMRLRVDTASGKPADGPTEIPIGRKKVHILGRNARNDIVVDHKSISRQHCAFVFDGKQLLVQDLGSTHHTYVDGEQLEAREFVPLREGSMLKVGTHKQYYTLLGSTPESSAKGPSAAPVSGDASSSANAPIDNDEELRKVMGITGFAQPKSGRGKGANSAEHEAPKVMSAAAMDRHRRKMLAQGGGGKQKKPIAGPQRPPAGPARPAQGQAMGPPGGAPNSASSTSASTAPAPAAESLSPEQLAQQRAQQKLDRVAEQFRLPVTHEIHLQRHAKPVTTIDIDRSGARMASGSLDFKCRIFDFHGMKENKRQAFRELEPHENHGVVEVSYSPSGSHLLVATGSAQPRVYDRDATPVVLFRKGNYNLSDMARTVGHIAAVTGAHWHPQDANTMITSSTDGTVRTWDLRGKTHFEELLCWQVLKARSQQGRRVGVSRCRWGPDGKVILAGCQDGSLQLWRHRARYGLPDTVVRDAHGKGNEVTGLCFDADGGCKIASRGMDDTMKLWDVRRFKEPLRTFGDLEVVHSGADCVFSPDGSVVVCGTSVDSRNSKARGRVVFFDVEGHSDEPIYEVPLGFGESAISLAWHPVLNQVLVGTSAGNIVALYSPQHSKKGVMFSVGKQARARSEYFSSVDVTGGVILTPNALPMFADPKPKREQRQLDRKDPIKSKKPDFPGTGPTRPDFVPKNYNYTAAMVEQRTKERYLDADPRASLLEYDAATKADPYWVEPSYAATQPVKILAEKTAQQEKEDLKKQRKGQNQSFIGGSELK